MINEDSILCGYLVSSCLTLFLKVNETQKHCETKELIFMKKNVYRKIIKVELIFKGLYL